MTDDCPTLLLSALDWQVPHVRNYMDRPWFFLGPCSARSIMETVCKCSITPVRALADYDALPREVHTVPMPCIRFRELVFKGGKVYKDVNLFIGQCDRCERIYWAERV